MSGDDMADDVYQPTGTGDEREGAGPLDPEDTLDEPGYDEQLDQGYSPPEKPRGVLKTGTTAAEQREGESFEERLAQEVPDVTGPEGDGLGDLVGGEGETVGGEVGTDRAGRLVAPDEGAHPDTTKDLVATDAGIDGGAAGAEEAAVHVVEEPEEPDDPGAEGDDRGPFG